MMWRGRLSARAATAFGVGIGIAFTAAAGADAAILTNSGGTLIYVADSQKSSSVTFNETAPGTVVVARAQGDDDPLTAADGCTLVSLGVQYACAGVVRVVADGRDGEDVLDAGGGTGGLIQAAAAISGGEGDDVLFTGAGNDALSGDAGDDQLRGGFGADTFSGGAGVDYAGLGSTTSIAVSLDGVANDGASGEGDNVLVDVEDVGALAATTGTVALIGSDTGNELTVTQGQASIVGQAGSDKLTGGSQGDVIDARDGFPDRVKCGDGADTATADMLDTVSQDCENVQIVIVHGGADDRPPAIAWAAPASDARLSPRPPPILSATASDDRGIALVRFYDDTRLLCEDPTAPYECAYRPRGRDVGRNTLLAVAVDGAEQTASAARAVDLRRFRARRLTLSMRRRAAAPGSFAVRGRLGLPGGVSRSIGCHGTVTVRVKAGRGTLATRRTRLRRSCRYRTRVMLGVRPGSAMRVTARFEGNRVVAPRSTRSRRARRA